MRDGIRALLSGNLDLSLGDQRPRDRGAEQVAAFIKGIGAEHGKNEVADELFTQVFDEDFAGADFFGLLLDRSQFFALPQVSAEGNHFTLVGVDQPTENNRGIQSAAIGEDNFLHVCHSGTLPEKSASTLTCKGEQDNEAVRVAGEKKMRKIAQSQKLLCAMMVRGGKRM